MKLFPRHTVFRITCAEPTKLLSLIMDAGFAIDQVIPDGDLGLKACVTSDRFPALASLVKKYGAEITVIEESSPWAAICTLAKRPVLLVMLICLVLSLWYLPTRILFVQIEGNDQLPDKLILEGAAQCGIRFGASRRNVRSEKTKNQLLQRIPQLQWAGVNTKGCIAVISVEEKNPESGNDDTPPEFSSIIAGRDGVILSCTATKGSIVCTEGQVVKEGQLLISPYTDGGFVIRATGAEGDVIARTKRLLMVKTPHAALKRGEMVDLKTQYGLRIGKKVIFFCKDSGISIPTCVKMYQEYCLKLPGGFALPVGFVKRTTSYYESLPSDTAEADFTWVRLFAKKYLNEHMQGGMIITETCDGQLLGDLYQFTGQYACVESIGLRRSEEILNIDG